MSDQLTDEWLRLHRGYAENHKRVPSSVALALLDEIERLRAAVVHQAEDMEALDLAIEARNDKIWQLKAQLEEVSCCVEHHATAKVQLPKLIQAWKGAWHGTEPEPEMDLLPMTRTQRCERNKYAAHALVAELIDNHGRSGVPHAEGIAGQCLEWLATAASAAIVAAAEASKPAQKPIKCDLGDNCLGHASPNERPCSYEPEQKPAVATSVEDYEATLAIHEELWGG